MLERMIRLIRASERDLPAICAIERKDGFAHLVARSSIEDHRKRLSRSDVAYWLAGRKGDGVDGFAIVTGLNDIHNGFYLLRIAVAEPGRGFGREFLGAIVDWAFTDMSAPRFHLDVLSHNLRARRAYAACGFLEDGVLRGAYAMGDGSRADRIVMSILPREFAQARAPADSP